MDAQQYRVCNKQFREQVENNPALRSKFSKEDLAIIRAGHAPRGLVWHHEAEPGKIKLVSCYVHKMTPHTGGRCLWGSPNK